MRQVEVIRPPIGCDRNRLLEARDRALEIALAVENLADAVERFRVVGLVLERRFESRPGALQIARQKGGRSRARRVQEGARRRA